MVFHFLNYTISRAKEDHPVQVNDEDRRSVLLEDICKCRDRDGSQQPVDAGKMRKAKQTEPSIGWHAHLAQI